MGWLYVFGEQPSGEIDHINGKRDDNRIENLRIVDKSGNQKNAKLTKRSTSGIMGVTWHSRDKEWTVRINANKKRIHVGVFDSFLDACCARKSLEISLGYHKNHGRR